MPQTVYLDVNTISNLLGRPGKGWTAAGMHAVRNAMLGAQKQGRIEFIGSHYHVEEASRRAPEPRRRFFSLFWDAVRWNLLIPVNELVPAEAAARSALVDTDPFETFERQQAIRRVTRSSATLFEMGADVAAFVGSNALASESRRDEIKLRLRNANAGKSPAEAMADWWKNSERELSEWVADYMALESDHLGLPADRESWPSSRDMQSAWAITAYVAARAFLVVGMHKPIGDGDTYDAFHYASACYADVLVTEDAAFRETMAVIPNNPVTLLGFDQFASQLGISPQ